MIWLPGSVSLMPKQTKGSNESLWGLWYNQ